ncbi:MAG TPA: DNA repair protein RecO [Casimicrobiaceae bacterium]|nr:DNA repair protein RecO [Casimicrobiaceae bacterium]
MGTRALSERHDDQPAYVLHAYAYKETSLIVEAFVREFGRVGLVAKGAKRPRSEMRGLLQAFQPLALSWGGTTELKTLVKAEWRGGMARPAGRALMSAFYLNELVLKLLAREDPHPRLWDEYENALALLSHDASASAQATTLRNFELRLLTELGYALPLDLEAGGGAIDPTTRYHYAFDKGAHRVAAEPGARWPIVRGATLIALAQSRYPDTETAAEAKRLMREILDHYLESRRIESRRIAADLAALDDESNRE